MCYAGTKKYYILQLAQRPGALRDFLSFLGPEDDFARLEYLKKFAGTAPGLPEAPTPESKGLSMSKTTMRLLKARTH